jgi:glycosyltransferase involved in cell wall biosynthesis
VMKILVLAQTPPPLHGQSQMVETLVSGLPEKGIEVRHVQLRLSRSHADIGRWRMGKIFTAALAALTARRVARREDCDALYYVPAPAKRGALYRDVVVMGICRDRRRKLVLHWHAPGLGAWLAGRATPPERTLALRALGGADLSIVLAPELESDAMALAPRRTAVVANGIPDPGPAAHRAAQGPREVLFLGLGSWEKGLHDAVEAVSILNARRPGSFRLTFAGSLGGERERRYFIQRSMDLGSALRHAGFANEAQKRELFSGADVFCLPTVYPNEGQPLALIEALAYDLPIVTTRWRAIPGMLPAENVWFVEPGRPSGLATALEEAAAAPRPAGAMRRHFLAHYTRERHLDSMKAALLSLGA